MRGVAPAVATACCLLAIACVGESGPPAATEYTLIGAVAVAGPPGARVEAPDERTLRVAQVSAAPWLLRNEIYYRLDYHDPGRIAPYARARWLDSAPGMLETLVSDALERSGAWRAILGPGNAAATDLTLDVTLLDLVQVFPSPAESYGVLRARATLVDAHSGTVIAQRAFDYRVAAPTPDAAGGVHAEREASHRLARDVAAWAGSRSTASRTGSRREGVR